MEIYETVLQSKLIHIEDSQHIRYKLRKEYCPSKYKVPHKFEPKISKIGLTKLIIKEANELIIKFIIKTILSYFSRKRIEEVLEKRINLKEEILKFYTELKLRYDALFDRPCEYGVFDGILGGYLPKKDRCTGCLRCWQEYPNVARIEINKKFLDMKKSLAFFSINLNDFYTILHEAETGDELVKGMGYKGQFAGPSWDGIWLDMSEIVRPTRDGKEGREYISTAVDIGSRKDRFYPQLKSSKTFRIEIPVFFDYQEEEFTNYLHQKAIAIAAERCSTFAIVSLKNFEKLINISSNLIPLIKKEEYFNENYDKILKKTKIIEIEYEEYADDLLKSLKDKEDKILIARINSKDNLYRKLLKAIENGFDSIHIVFNWDARENPKRIIREIHEELLKKGMRNEISILGSRCATMAEHVVKAMICGLDAVGIDVAIHVALQSEFKLVRGKAKIVPRKIDVEWGSQRLINLISAWHEQIIEALSAMGKRDVRRLRGDVGRAIFYEEIRKEAFGDIECLH
jgi:hypothetical protein